MAAGRTVPLVSGAGIRGPVTGRTGCGVGMLIVGSLSTPSLDNCFRLMKCRKGASSRIVSDS